jgi:hypothetical protein
MGCALLDKVVLKESTIFHNGSLIALLSKHNTNIWKVKRNFEENCGLEYWCRHLGGLCVDA